MELSCLTMNSLYPTAARPGLLCSDLVLLLLTYCPLYRADTEFAGRSHSSRFGYYDTQESVDGPVIRHFFMSSAGISQGAGSRRWSKSRQGSDWRRGFLAGAWMTCRPAASATVCSLYLFRMVLCWRSPHCPRRHTPPPPPHWVFWLDSLAADIRATAIQRDLFNGYVSSGAGLAFPARRHGVVTFASARKASVLLPIGRHGCAPGALIFLYSRSGRCIAFC